MNRPFFPVVSLFLGIALLQVGTYAQPNVAPDAKTSVPTLSIAELETYLGGRTLLSVDLKDATLEEVAAALSQASGQKIVLFPMMAPNGSARTIMTRPGTEGVVPAPPASTVVPAAPQPLFNLSTTNTPFWEALRSWQLAARTAAEKAKVLSLKQPFNSNDNVPNSVGVQKAGGGFWLQPGNTLANGRAVSAWPFLVVATDLRRTQEARLSETGLREIEARSDPFSRVFDAKALAGAVQAPQPKTATLQAPTPEEKRWSDRLVLTTFVLPDPKLNPTGLRCEVVEAVDEKGNDLRLNEGVSNSFNGSYQDLGSGPPLQILLSSRPDMGKRLVKLRGVLRFSVVTRTGHWETTELQTPVEDTLHLDGGDFKVKFNGVKENGPGWTADFSAESRGAHLERFWNNRRQSLINSGDVGGRSGILEVLGMSLVDADGHTWAGGRTITEGFGFGHVDPATNVTAPVNTSLDISPVPPDVTQNWTYWERRTLAFGPDGAGYGEDLLWASPSRETPNLVVPPS